MAFAGIGLATRALPVIFNTGHFDALSIALIDLDLPRHIGAASG